MPRQHPSSATTPCSNCCQLASCISQARESRTTSPTRRSASAFPCGNSAAHRRRDCLLTTNAGLHRRNSASFLFYVQSRAAVVVEGAIVTPLQHGATTMLALGLLLNTVGLGLFCW